MSGTNCLREYEIGLGMLMISTDPAILSISGIGSCIALAIRDIENSASGLAHIVLPASKDLQESCSSPGRYADTAVRTLVQGLLASDSVIQRLRAKLAGGARALTGSGFDGYRNVVSTRNELAKSGVVIEAEDVGLAYGRSVKFDTSSGKITIRRYHKNCGIAEFKDEIMI